MTERADTVTCRQCGRKYRVPEGRDIDRDTFVCPACAKGKKRPAPKKDDADQRGQTTLLEHCPVCGRGRVSAEGTESGTRRYTCDQCNSIIEESIFGFAYKQIDAHYKNERERLEGNTFSLLELRQLAQARAPAEDKSRSQKEAEGKTPANTKPETDTEAEPAPEKRKTAEPASEQKDDTGELYWMIDHEAAARREREKKKAKKKGVTVDDLLEDLGRDQKE